MLINTAPMRFTSSQSHSEALQWIVLLIP
jgi:hypothetical protein